MERASASSELGEAMQATCLGTRVARLHRVVTRSYERALRSLGLSMPQVEVLATLATEVAPVRPSALAAGLCLERSTLSRNLALLQRRGWVAAGQTSPGGRSMTVAITDDGRSLLAAAGTAWAEAQAEVAAALGIGAADTLDRWVAGLADLAELP